MYVQEHTLGDGAMLVVWVFGPGSPGVKPLVGRSGVGQSEMKSEVSLALLSHTN